MQITKLYITSLLINCKEKLKSDRLIKGLITQLIIIDIAPLTVLFYNCVFVSLVLLTGNRKFRSGDFWDKWPSGTTFSKMHSSIYP